MTSTTPRSSALRTQLVVAASVTDPAWLAAVPNERPVLMIGEGLTMYHTE